VYKRCNSQERNRYWAASWKAHSKAGKKEGVTLLAKQEEQTSIGQHPKNEPKISKMRERNQWHINDGHGVVLVSKLNVESEKLHGNQLALSKANSTNLLLRGCATLEWQASCSLLFISSWKAW